MAAQKQNTNYAKKELLYRGKKIDELKSMDVRESAKYLPATSKRYVLRNFNVIERFIKRCNEKTSKNKRIKTHQRELVIVPQLVDLTVWVYNGKEFKQVEITGEMIGCRLGEFAMTRAITKHGSAGVGATKGSRAQKK